MLAFEHARRSVLYNLVYSDLSLSQLNHRLPWGQTHPEVMQGTADLHHEIADAVLPQSVWLKYCVTSRGLSMRVAEQSTEALPPHHVPCLVVF